MEANAPKTAPSWLKPLSACATGLGGVHDLLAFQQFAGAAAHHVNAVTSFASNKYRVIARKIDERR